MTTINKNYEIDNIQILGDLDLPLKIRHQELLNGVVFSIFSDDSWARGYPLTRANMNGWTYS